MTLEQLKKLCDETTHGKWKGRVQVETIGHGMIGFRAETPSHLDEAPAIRDARFIAAAHTYMPLLLAVAEAAEDFLRCPTRSYEPPLAEALKALDDVEGVSE